MRKDVGICYLILAAVTGLGLLRLIPVSVHMVVSATVIIFIGAHGSVPQLQVDHHSYDDTCEHCRADNVSGKLPTAQPVEQMQTRDAMMFPVYGSCVLLAIYLVLKLVAKEYVMVVVKAYFFVLGVLVLGHRIRVIASAFISHATLHAIDKKLFRFKWPRMPWESAAPAAAPAADAAAAAATAAPADGAAASAAAAAAGDGGEDVTRFDLVCYALSLVTGFAYVYWNHWALSNMFGIVFCLQGIEMLSLGSYLNGTILLCGLFVYDIFWVFGTEVMVSVAKGFDAPIKLIFPQFMDTEKASSMLGLGDIVIPGIFLALILRFDFRSLPPLTGPAPVTPTHDGAANGNGAASAAAAVAPATAAPTAESISRSYFFVVLAAYVFGLLTTVFIMYTFDAAQPALLYLVPACLLSSMGMALVRGDARTLWNFTEADPKAAATSATVAPADGAAKKDN